MKVGKTALIQLFSDLRRKGINDAMFRTLIESVWRDSLQLYNEQCDKGTAAEPTGYLPNEFADTIDFGLAIGQDNLIEGNRSAAIGQGNNTKAFMELLLGAYATIAIDQDPDNWVATDRLAALGNGTDDETRSLVFEAFKSGLFKFLNAIVIGDYSHGAIESAAGTIKYTEADGLFLKHLGEWLNLNKPLPISKTSGNTINAAGHTHSITTPVVIIDDDKRQLSEVIYGHYFNWHTIADVRGICAGNAHIPTDVEWQALFDAVGGNSVAGGKLREAGYAHWAVTDPPTPGTDDYGFKLLPCGWRDNNGNFDLMGVMAFMWTSTTQNQFNAWNLICADLYIGPDYSMYGCGYCIRLIVDAPINIVGNTAVYVGNDGQHYKCIMMPDGKWWLAVNLMETEYATHDPIPEITNNSAWTNTIVGARCSYNNSTENSGTVGGIGTQVLIGEKIPNGMTKAEADAAYAPISVVEDFETFLDLILS